MSKILDKAVEAFREAEPHAIINRAALRMAINAVLEVAAQEAWEGGEGDGSEWDSSAIAAAKAIRELKI